MRERERERRRVERERCVSATVSATPTATATTTTSTATATTTTGGGTSTTVSSRSRTGIWSECEKCGGRMKHHENESIDGRCKKCQIEYEKHTHCFVCDDFYRSSSNSVPWVSCPYCVRWFHYDCCAKDDQDEFFALNRKNSKPKEMVDCESYQCKDCRKVRQNKKDFEGKTIRQTIEGASEYMDLLLGTDRERIAFESLPRWMDQSKKVVEDKLHHFQFADVREVPWKWEICSKPFEKPSPSERQMLEIIGNEIKVLFHKPKRWFHGTVVSYNFKTKKHRVKFDDGDLDYICLDKGPCNNQEMEDEFELLGRKDLPSLRKKMQTHKRKMEREEEKKKKKKKIVNLENNTNMSMPLLAQGLERPASNQPNPHPQTKGKQKGKRAGPTERAAGSPQRSWNVNSKKKRTMNINSQRSTSGKAFVKDPSDSSLGGQRQRQRQGREQADVFRTPDATVMSQVQEAAAQLKRLLSKLNDSGELRVEEAEGALEQALDGVGDEYERLLRMKEGAKEEEERKKKIRAQQKKIKPQSDPKPSDKSQIYLKNLEKELASSDVYGIYEDARETCLHLYGLRLFHFQKQDGDWQVIPTVVKSLQKHPLEQVRRAVTQLLKVSPGLKDAIRHIPQEKWLRYTRIRDEGRIFVYKNYAKHKFIEVKLGESPEEDTAVDLQVTFQFTEIE